VKLTDGSALPEVFRNVDLHAVGSLYLELYAVNAHNNNNNNNNNNIKIACKILGLVNLSGPICIVVIGIVSHMVG